MSKPAPGANISGVTELNYPPLGEKQSLKGGSGRYTTKKQTVNLWAAHAVGIPAEAWSLLDKGAQHV